MWKIITAGNPIFTGTEADCRKIFLGYSEWSVWRGAASAALLQAELGAHPATWALPVELVDAAGKTEGRVSRHERENAQTTFKGG